MAKKLGRKLGKKLGRKLGKKNWGKFCMPKAKKVGFVFSCWTGEKVNLPEQNLKAEQILSSLKINCRSVRKNNLCHSVRKKVFLQNLCPTEEKFFYRIHVPSVPKKSFRAESITRR